MGIRKKRAVSPKATARVGLADALFSKIQQQMLAYLFGQPDRSFLTTELIKLAGGASGAVQRELARLTQSGLVTVTRVGTQKRYQANPQSPIFSELCAIVQKTVGLAEPLRRALAPFAKRIKVAFVFGSVAKRSDTASSDIDVFVISDDLDYADMFDTLQAAEAELHRTVSPTISTTANWRKKQKERNAFVTKVMVQPKMFLIGGEADLG